jgi:hypothetical protein
MGRRRGDIFSKRDYNYGSRLFSNLVTGLIVSPFAIMSALPSSSSYDDHDPISRKAAIILLIIGVALAPLFIPWFAFGFEFFDFPFIGVFITFAIVFIPLMVWGAILYLSIESFWKRRGESKSTDESKVRRLNQYELIVKSIAEQNENSKYDFVRAEYFRTLETNANIEAKIIKCEESISRLETKIKRFGKIFNLTDKYQRMLDSNRSELAILRNSKLKESIVLNQEPFDKSGDLIVNGDVCLSLNTTIEPFQRLNLSRYSKMTHKDGLFFDVDSLPRQSLLFASIEMCFYSDCLLLMTKDDFVVVDRESISMSYRTFSVEMSASNVLPYYNVIGTKWRHSRLDGGPDLRYKNNTEDSLVELGLIEIKINAQTINLLFTESLAGRLVYKAIS